MFTSLIDQFLSQECTPYVRRLLEDAIADTSIRRPRFEFNLFEITIDRDSDVVIIESVLDASESSVQHVPLNEFSKSLTRCSA